MIPKHRIPAHPGHILREEFLPSLLAERIGVSERTAREVLRAERAVSSDMARRLAAAFGTTRQFWLNLQAQHTAATRRTERRPR